MSVNSDVECERMMSMEQRGSKRRKPAIDEKRAIGGELFGGILVGSNEPKRSTHEVRTR